MKVTVYTPNPNFTGERMGVQFKDGKAEVNDKLARYLVANFGYHCPELEKKKGRRSGKKTNANEKGKPTAPVMQTGGDTTNTEGE